MSSAVTARPVIGSLRLFVLVLTASSAVIVLAFAFRSSRAASIGEPAVAVVPSRDNARLRPPGETDRPHIEITADHQLRSVQHKNASGLSPLELLQTPAGQVRIQRTFTSDGILLKEEAFLNGKSVPIPQN